MQGSRNAPLGPKGRETMVLRVLEQGWSRTEAAEAAGVSGTHLLEAEDHARPGRGPGRAAGRLVGAEVDPAPHAGLSSCPGDSVLVAAAADDGRGRSRCASRWRCRRSPPSCCGSDWAKLQPARAARAAEPLQSAATPAKPPHVDVKKSPRGSPKAWRRPSRPDGNRRLQRSPRRRDAAGRDCRLSGPEFVHVCVYDATRGRPTSKSSPREGATNAVGFPLGARSPSTRATASRRPGRDVRQTAPATAPRFMPSPAARSRCRHLRTRPYRPRTNGKAERLHRHLPAGSGLRAPSAHGSSRERTAALDVALDLQPSLDHTAPQPQDPDTPASPT